MCDKRPVQLTTGVALTVFGILTSSYIIYSRFCSPHPSPLGILLSETLATVAVGALHLYWYSSCATTSQNTTGQVGASREPSHDLSCVDNHELWMHHAVMIAAATHCFISLVSASIMCNTTLNKTIQEADESKEIKKRNDGSKNVLLDTVRSPICGNVIGQWLVPALGVLCVYYVVYGDEICSNTTLTTIVDGFQSVVNELLEQSQVVSDNETSAHREEIKSIVDRVYTIVDSVTNNTEMTSIEDEHMEMFNIIEKLNSFNARTPKQIGPKFVYSTRFKIFTIFFISFVYLIVAYTNVKYVKTKMLCGEINSENRNKQNLQTNVKYLKMLITAAVILWTPSLTELFARTFIGENQPNILSQILMASGTAYMLVRDGINLKLLKANMKTKNCVEPSA